MFESGRTKLSASQRELSSILRCWLRSLNPAAEITLRNEGMHAGCLSLTPLCTHKKVAISCQLRAHSLSTEGNLMVGSSFTEDCFTDKHCKNFVTSCFLLSPLSSPFPILLQNFLLLVRKNFNGNIWICRMGMERTASSCSALWNCWKVTRRLFHLVQELLAGHHRNGTAHPAPLCSHLH